MIKIFRKIRYNLMETGKTSKYLKYAMGEILLVMIGILLALQVNNWNEARNLSKKQHSLLMNLKDDLTSDLEQLRRSDSIFSIKEVEGEQAIKLFHNAKTIKDIDSSYKLMNARWNVLYINSNAYTEMVNTGSMYSMKNKNLQKLITRHYLRVDADKNYIEEVNQGQAYLHNRTAEMQPFLFLINQYRNPTIDLKRIDTSWINNPNSKTYLAVDHFLKLNQSTNNIYRRSVYQRNIERTIILLEEVNKELENRD